eukprot:1160432-Pelagomonas_calceolata.AAC.1
MLDGATLVLGPVGAGPVVLMLGLQERGDAGRIAVKSMRRKVWVSRSMADNLQIPISSVPGFLLGKLRASIRQRFCKFCDCYLARPQLRIPSMKANRPACHARSASVTSYCSGEAYYN